ncbi:MAG TPA: tetratricopeptide repeat protein [Tahibacter sp.]|nr:tetratricopeptide repeat protein [Tahibacter sp.]
MAQHPRFEAFKSAWRDGDYAAALGHIDAVLADHPLAASLHWYRANCLQRLDRVVESRAAVERVLALKPDHAAALVRQVELDDGSDDMADIDDERASKKAIAEYERRTAERRQRHIAQLRQALAIDPSLADAYFGLSQLLRYAPDGEPAAPDGEADALLERAIALEPARVEFLVARADAYRMRAITRAADVPEPERVVTFGGVAYARADLEAALRDYALCARIDGTHRYLLRMASVLHDLGRYDDALAQYDAALRLVPPDSPYRQHIVEMRARSENGGAGERDEMATMLEGLIAKGDRNLADDQVATALLGAARAVRGGQNLGDAIAARVSESPDDFLAANIAEQILNVAFEHPPELLDVDPATFPAFQRQYAARQRKALEAAGARHVAYAEATGMTPTLGQRVMIGLYAGANGDGGIATFAMKPKWPGLVGFLMLFFTGKWKVHSLTECVTLFDDDAYLNTQYESISPFGYGGKIDIERLPRSTSVAALVARHAQRVDAYRQAHPHARALPTASLADADANWRRGQAIKRAYRRSIGYVTDAELRTLLGAHYDRFADKVRGKLLELAADREERALDDA